MKQTKYYCSKAIELIRDFANEEDGYNYWYVYQQNCRDLIKEIDNILPEKKK